MSIALAINKMIVLGPFQNIADCYDAGFKFISSANTSIPSQQGTAFLQIINKQKYLLRAYNFDIFAQMNLQ